MEAFRGEFRKKLWFVDCHLRVREFSPSSYYTTTKQIENPEKTSDLSEENLIVTLFVEEAVNEGAVVPQYFVADGADVS